MNTDIYCEINKELSDMLKIAHRASSFSNLDEKESLVSEKGFEKWLKKTEKWRKKCEFRMFARPWSATKKIYVASVNKK